MSVTPPKSKDVLITTAGRLAKAAPNSWTDFIEALNHYARERTDACVQAPSDKVQIAQGMARQVNELLTLLTDAAKQK